MVWLLTCGGRVRGRCRMSRSEEEDISTSESTTQAGQQLSISDFLLHALTTGRIKQSSKKRRLGRLAATVGVLLHRLDARLSLEGDTLRERVCLVGFFISVPFISIAAVFWAATLIAYGKYYAAIAPLVYICTAAVTSTLLFWRRIRPQVWGFFFFAFCFLSSFFSFFAQLTAGRRCRLARR